MRVQALLPAVVVGLLASPASAATFVVTKETDEAGACTPGDCALREAVLAANANPGADEIEVPAGTYLLSLVGPVEENFGLTGDLDLREAVEIRGASAETTVVVGDGTDRVLQSHAAGVVISGLTFTGAVAPNSGGGVRSDGDSFVLRDCIVSDNATVNGDGGGIFLAAAPSGTILIENCTIAGNTALSRRGGGLYAAGGNVFGRIDLVNVTVSSNEAFIGGGLTFTADSFITLNHLTVADNEATSSIVDGLLGDGAPNLSIENSLFANNDCGYLATVPDTNGHNMEGPTSTCFFPGDGNTMGVPDIMLGPLADNGGSTPTHALVPGSPAIDAALNADCPATDQRGFPRPEDGNADGSAVCDVGAFELLGPTSALEIPAFGEVGRFAFAVLAALAGILLLRQRSGS